MPRDPRYDVLFEPVRIGPVVAKNRFYQVPHCNGGGYRDPSAAAEMRKIKAEGGWGVIFTEQCEMHHTSEITPFIELRLWDDQDIPALARMAEKSKEHGALAGIELAYSGINGPNLYTREVPLAPTALPDPHLHQRPRPRPRHGQGRHPRPQALVRERGETRQDRRLRSDLPLRRPRLRHLSALSLDGHQPAQRRVWRQPREPLAASPERSMAGPQETPSATASGLTLRISLDETIGDLGFSNAELRDFIEMHRDLPDLWDLAHGSWEDCSGPSRFKEEAAQADLVPRHQER